MMFRSRVISGLLAGFVGSGLCVLGLSAQTTPTPAAATKAVAAPKTTATPYRFQGRSPQQAERYYGIVWGVDTLRVKWAESGELLRFSYHVLDPVKAKTLNDKKLEPSLEDPQASVSLVVPQLEFVGKMRNTVDPEAGKSYWVAFSNRGRQVKRGDHVNVIIGKFRANGLIVD